MAGPVGVTDERTFVELTAPHRAALHAHAYRLLGSLHDADDALQETMLRAWRSIDRFEPRAPLRAWLYRIATNVCLRMLEQRARRPAIAPDAHLEPYPTQPLVPDPGAIVEEREAIGLAFVTAMQLLPARQRAVLVLRDVLDWPARDVAELLDETVPAVNSLLQRARARVDREHTDRELIREHVPRGAANEAAVMQRFQAAWEAVDIAGLLALLTDDALLTMPPEGVAIRGAEAIGMFFATQPLGGRLDRIPMRAVRANGQPAFACYADEDVAGDFRPYGVMVFALDGDLIDGITGFPRRPDLFARLGAPPSI